jgi:hypothetical protein
MLQVEQETELLLIYFGLKAINTSECYVAHVMFKVTLIWLYWAASLCYG